MKKTKRIFAFALALLLAALMLTGCKSTLTSIAHKLTGTAEGVQKFKISLWKKVDGGAQYVDNTTYYFVTDGQNYHCDIGNLDPNASYRLTISYDSSKYYLYGLLKVEGIGG